MQTNNKCREALTAIQDICDVLLSDLDATEIDYMRDKLTESIREKCKAALASPRLNCEVGTAEEQGERFETFCSLHHLPKGKGCYSCPALPPRSPHAFQRYACRAIWARMPYTEGENNGDK